MKECVPLRSSVNSSMTGCHLSMKFSQEISSQSTVNSVEAIGNHGYSFFLVHNQRLTSLMVHNSHTWPPTFWKCFQKHSSSSFLQRIDLWNMYMKADDWILLAILRLCCCLMDRLSLFKVNVYLHAHLWPSTAFEVHQKLQDASWIHPISWDHIRHSTTLS